MRDRVNFFAVKQIFYRFAVAKIDVVNRHVASETGNIRTLDLRVIEVVEVVENDDLMPGGQQLLDKMRANKSSTACHEDSHCAN
jgi:hypothetical protein